MTQPMEVLFHYLSERYILPYLSKDVERRWARDLEDLEEALQATFTAEQQAMWEKYQNAQLRYNIAYDKALFEAAFAMRRELA